MSTCKRRTNEAKWSENWLRTTVSQLIVPYPFALPTFCLSLSLPSLLYQSCTPYC
jgi:hypothetical protein